MELDSLLKLNSSAVYIDLWSDTYTIINRTDNNNNENNNNIIILL